jgi:hypothetical protein
MIFNQLFSQKRQKKPRLRVCHSRLHSHRLANSLAEVSSTNDFLMVNVFVAACTMYVIQRNTTEYNNYNKIQRIQHDTETTQ